MAFVVTVTFSATVFDGTNSIGSVVSCIVTLNISVIPPSVSVELLSSLFPAPSVAKQVTVVVAPVPLTGNVSAVLLISMLFRWTSLVKLPSGELTHFSSVRSTKSNAFTV